MMESRINLNAGTELDVSTYVVAEFAVVNRL